MRDMLGRGEAVSPSKAIELIFSHLSTEPIPTETLPLEDSFGRILSKDMHSPEDMPGFPRSSMDGFAVRSSDTFGATEAVPLYLSLTGEIEMGSEPAMQLGTGEAVKISTGGMLPGGADAVLMLEYAQTLDASTIEVLKPVGPGENVIRRDEDVKEGELLLSAGRRLMAHDVAALAGVGYTRAEVFRRPRVSILSTGDEILPAGAPSKPGFVRDMNSYNLAGLVAADGGEPVRAGVIKDEYPLLLDAVRSAVSESDIVLVSGGSSVGARDYTARAIDEAGRPGVLFHGVTMKPGKPLMAGYCGGVPVFGLPGHPAAVSVCYEVFIKPLLRAMSGEKERPEIIKVKAVLSQSVSSSSGREEYVRVSLEKRDGKLTAVPILGKSGLISTLVRADGLMVVPIGVQGISGGEVVEIRLLG